MTAQATDRYFFENEELYNQNMADSSEDKKTIIILIIICIIITICFPPAAVVTAPICIYNFQKINK